MVYDLAGRMTEREYRSAGATTGTADYTDTFAYDAVGNIASETRGGTLSGESWTATYDDEQRLSNWDVTTGADESRVTLLGGFLRLS